ncbi:hypothetical protein Tco_0794610 [Tanacetum coccineum]
MRTSTRCTSYLYDDFSRYGYVLTCLKHKHEVFGTFKVSGLRLRGFGDPANYKAAMLGNPDTRNAAGAMDEGSVLSLACDKDVRKSKGRVIVFVVNEGAVDWKSKKDILLRCLHHRLNTWLLIRQEGKRKRFGFLFLIELDLGSKLG